MNVDHAEVIQRPFLDREGNDESLLGGIVFGNGRDHLHVGKAVLQIEAADQIAVGFDAVGIVDVGGLQKAQEVEIGRS